MKKSFLILLVIPMLVFSQNFDYQRKYKKHSNRISEIERIKLLDYLDLDEETAVKFFARKNELDKSVMLKMKEIRKAQNELEELIENENDEKISELVGQVLNGRQEIAKMKKDFIYSLNDILNSTQIAKVVIFEDKFQREIRKFLYKRRNKESKWLLINGTNLFFICCKIAVLNSQD